MGNKTRLNKEQFDAVRFYKGACNVIASAGSGKTMVIVGRVEHLIRCCGVPPEKILVVTFSRKARDELRGRLFAQIPGCAMDVAVTTFHSLGNQIVCWKYGRKHHVLGDEKEQLRIINSILFDMGALEYNGKHDAEYYLQFIAATKNRLEKPSPDTIEGAVYYAYERQKDRTKTMDFDDMVVRALNILQGDPDVCKVWQDKYEFVLVDEVQDISAAQYELLRLICGKNKNLFVVGDPLQNIYQWRGSDNRFILNFKEDWPGAVVMHLHTNYRSSWNIVDASNRFAECIPETSSKIYMKSVANRPPIQDAIYHCHTSPTEEAEAVMDMISSLVKNGYSYSDIAVLARTNEYLNGIKEELSKKGIPFNEEYDLSAFARPETMLVICYMRLIANHGDDDAFEYIYCRPKRSLGKTFLITAKEISTEKHLPLYETMEEAAQIQSQPKFVVGVKKLRSVIENFGSTKYENMKDLISDLRKFADIDHFVSEDKQFGKEAVKNLDYLEEMASKYVDINHFLDDVRLLMDNNINTDSAVKILTIHKSKGLEFPIVFVIGLNPGLFPSYKNEDINEERRLMYVAMTRSENMLYVSSSDGEANRHAGGEFVPEVLKKLTPMEGSMDDVEVCETLRDRGDFVWMICDAAKILMPNLKPATLTRLMLLVSYMDYDNVLVGNDGIRLTVSNIQDILCVSNRSMYNIMNELETAGIMKFGDGISVNPKIFFRGYQNRVEQSMVYQEGKMIVRLYKKGIRSLCKPTADLSAKKLSYIFRILPFINRQYNIVCFNPLETNLNMTKPIPLGELAEIIGCNRSNSSRLKNILLEPVFETSDGISHAIHIVCGDRIGIERNCLFVNPGVCYGGNRHHEVSAFGRFKED